MPVSHSSVRTCGLAGHDHRPASCCGWCHRRSPCVSLGRGIGSRAGCTAARSVQCVTCAFASLELRSTSKSPSVSTPQHCCLRKGQSSCRPARVYTSGHASLSWKAGADLSLSLGSRWSATALGVDPRPEGLWCGGGGREAQARDALSHLPNSTPATLTTAFSCHCHATTPQPRVTRPCEQRLCKRRRASPGWQQPCQDVTPDLCTHES